MPNIIKNNKKIHHSNSSFILNYINYLNKERIVKYQGIQENAVMTQSKYRFFNEKINDEFEKSEKMIKKDDYFVKSKDYYNNDEDQNKFNQFVKKFGKTRIMASNSMQNLLNKRNQLNQSLRERIKYEKMIKDIVSGTLNLGHEELTSISRKAKEVLPEDFKGLEELNSIINKKQEEDKKKGKGNKNGK